MKTFVTFTFLTFFTGFLTTKAQFSGNYGPTNWTTTTPGPSNGTVNTANAPDYIILNGSNGGGGLNVITDFTIAASESGTWGFDWEYHSNDETPFADPAYVLVNGIATQLSNNGGAFDQSGSYSVPVSNGDIIGFRVKALDNCCGNATLKILNFVAPSSGATLPVKLASFTGMVMGNKQIKLDWITAVETNSNRFEIERSTDGHKFEKIGTIAAVGNTNQTHKYSFNDFSPTDGTNYYRLKQVDNDELTTYSKVVSLKYTNSGKMSVYPNPARDFININIGQINTSGKEFIKLYNVNGKLLESRQVTLPSSNNIKWDVSHLTSGTYYFKVGNNAELLNFIKN